MTALPIILETHASTYHDAGVAVYFPDTDRFVALGSERVDRVKHSMSFTAARDHVWQHFGLDSITRPVLDHSLASYAPFSDPHHHLAHAASAFFASGFEEAAVLVMDAQGPYPPGSRASTSYWRGAGASLVPIRAVKEEGPFCWQSLGHFYSAISYYLGFGRYQEGHTMALSAYGGPSRLCDAVDTLLRPLAQGFAVDSDFIHFTYATRYGARYGWKVEPRRLAYLQDRYAEMLGPLREPGALVDQRVRNLAWCAQARLEETVVHIGRELHEATGLDRVCLAGGIALNGAANHRLLIEGPFRALFIQPAANDSGQALGKLLYRVCAELRLRKPWKMEHAYLGPEYSEQAVAAALRETDGVRHEKLTAPVLIRETVDRIASGKVVAWFEGGSEIGPRALGHRSILADPRSPTVRDHLNLHVKHRESFRPFAPSVLEEYAATFFELDAPSPFMLLIVPVREEKRHLIPAVTHVDGSARVQTVSARTAPHYHALIRCFAERTGVPMLLNTSFNCAGEPIVETPADAVHSFLRMNLDSLILWPFLVEKA
jgi:carbamoyltransferase